MPAEEVNTLNEFALSSGENLPNHSTSMKGLGRFIRSGVPVVPTFRTKQQAYRFAARLVVMAEALLPDEEGAEEHDFDRVREAIRNT